MLRPVRTFCLLACFAFDLTRPANAQTTASSLADALKASLLGKTLPVRDFLGEQVVRYRWQGGHFVHDPQQLYSTGVFLCKSVKVTEEHGKPSHVTLRGERRIALRDEVPGHYGVAALVEPLSFEIDLGEADEAALAALSNTLFFADFAAMIQAVPQEWKRVAPAGPDIGKMSSQKEGSWVEENGSWIKTDASDGSLDPVKVEFAPAPEFSEQARRDKASGIVDLGLIVGLDGKVKETWLLKPVGHGLDEKAIAAGRQYRFAPRMHHGQPVASAMVVELNFQIY